jgi:hypothetical protein
VQLQREWSASCHRIGFFIETFEFATRECDQATSGFCISTLHGPNLSSIQFPGVLLNLKPSRSYGQPRPR